MKAIGQSTLPVRARRTIGMVVVACMIAIASLFASAGSASAIPGGSISNCHGPWFRQNPDICVRIQPGQKDARTHMQFISWVEGDQAGPAPDHFMEVWGDGFYYSWFGVLKDFNINRWVRSGTNICAAETDYEHRRVIACFGIRV